MLEIQGKILSMPKLLSGRRRKAKAMPSPLLRAILVKALLQMPMVRLVTYRGNRQARHNPQRNSVYLCFHVAVVR